MILAILQARVSSARLPQKVIKSILGRPMLGLQLERLRRSRRIERLILATSVDPSDDALENLGRAEKVEVFRGNLDDVLDRFYQAALPFRPEHVVRLTGDCPLADPAIIDAVIDDHLASGADYTTNAVEPTWPDGLDVEVFKFRCLEEAWREADLPSQREHVTPFINTQPDRYEIRHVKGPQDLSALRWTVDEPADLELISIIYGELYPRLPTFSTADILELLERRPELKTLNSWHKRNEGLAKSLEKDKQAVMKPKSIAKSLAMQERAKARIPGMTQLLSKRPDLYSYGVWPGYYAKAQGCEVWDLDGNQYLDMSISGIGANVLGYADPDVDAAVRDAIANGSSSSLNCYEEVELADLLCELHPWADKVRYARTGGESMAVAVRIARTATGRDKIAFCGYHGWHDWYLAANVGTENALGEHLIAGLAPAGVPLSLAGTAIPFNYNSLSDLEKIVAEHGPALAAVVMEPIRNVPPAPGFLEGVRQLAHKAGAVFIFDEISSGLRMVTGGAHLTLGVQPDIAVFSKALGNGYPIGAVIGRGDVMDAAQRSFISSTCWTERVGPAAALATLRKHRSTNTGPHLMALGTAVQKGWTALAAKHGLAVHVGGIPPLSHFSFDREPPLSKAYFVQLMVDQGILASTIFYPMWAHRDEHVARYLDACDVAFAQVAEALTAGNIAARLRGAPAVSGFRRLN
jgi:glutamate-1-semialdehyde 2,1-aminomutase